MAKLTEKKRLLLTIGVAVALTGGLTALIFSDRSEIETLQSDIEELDTRIAAADVEIRKTREREDKVVVFRAVEARELAVLPRPAEDRGLLPQPRQVLRRRGRSSSASCPRAARSRATSPRASSSRGTRSSARATRPRC